MKRQKRIAVVFGMFVLAMMATRGVCGGAWVTDRTFMDDFNRADSWSVTNGPGWTSQSMVAAPYVTRWAILSQRLRNNENYDSGAYVTNFMVGSNYVLSVDVTWTTLAACGSYSQAQLSGNKAESSEAGLYLCVNGADSSSGAHIYMHNGASTIMYDIDPLSGIQANQWYHMMLQRSNEQARATLTGPGVDWASGWKSIPTGTVPATNYAVLSARTHNNNGDSVFLDNFSVTTYRLSYGAIFSFR